VFVRANPSKELSTGMCVFSYSLKRMYVYTYVYTNAICIYARITETEAPNEEANVYIFIGIFI